jgi:hypothetical protein
VDYTLAVLTHGRSGTLDQTLASFYDKVRPAPARVLLHADGPWMSAPTSGRTFFVQTTGSPQGFCKATGSLWKWIVADALAREPDAPEFVFWLEHDFVFLRPVDLSELADVLDDDARLAQMQLMRTPVSPEEIAAGGLYQMRQADYTKRLWEPLTAEYDPDRFRPWLEHRSYFTTNPSLLRTSFMAENRWPDDGLPECEGRYGIDLVQRGFTYGVWGSGEPWVEHVGVRDGFGY